MNLIDETTVHTWKNIAKGFTVFPTHKTYQILPCNLHAYIYGFYSLLNNSSLKVGSFSFFNIFIFYRAEETAYLLYLHKSLIILVKSFILFEFL